MLTRIFWITITFVSIVTIFIQVTFIAYLYTNPRIKISENSITVKKYISKLTDAEIEAEKLSQIKKNENMIHNTSNIKVQAWIADWGIKPALIDLQKRTNKISTINVFLFNPNKDGTLTDLINKDVDNLINFARSRNIQVIGTIPLFDPDILSSILNNKNNFQRHITEILKRVVIYNLSGIDLDYESIYLADKKLFFDFLENLSKEMRNLNKKLTFTVLAKWGDYVNYTSLPQTRRVQDYKRISDLVDEMRIMTYDFISKDSTIVGPIGPLPWIEKVIQYTISKNVEREKIVIGIHAYSFVWRERPILQHLDMINWFGNLTANNNSGTLVYNYEDVEAVKSLYPYKSSYNKTWGEEIINITIKNIPRIIVTINNQGIIDRKILAETYGINKVIYWRLGNNGNLEM